MSSMDEAMSEMAEAAVMTTDVVDGASTDAGVVTSAPAEDEFYVRYYVGHRGLYGHEFLEFELRPNGLLRYANNSSYKGDKLIQKEVIVSASVIQEMKRIVEESGIMEEDDYNWPEPNEDGRQELEVHITGKQPISFVTSKLGSLVEVEQLECASSIKSFYFLAQNLRCFVLSLISLHFKINPYSSTVRA